MSIFSRRLRELRDKTGETQDDIGKLLGKTKAAVSKYELGDRQPDLEDVKNLALHFNTTADFMLGLSDVKISAEHIPSNIKIIMDNLSLNEFVCNIEAKTGIRIDISEMDSYINGRVIPANQIIEALASYANVEPKFFYKRPDSSVNSKLPYPEMEELIPFIEVKGFKRVVRIASKILVNDLDIGAIEKIVDGMVDFKNTVLSDDKKKKHPK
ncbi:MAG: helix-turn-helix domain-containing protein [Clostridia bacterium]|nr:helix-turn-helix domain-containing protein [Clostridia bacterium]